MIGDFELESLWSSNDPRAIELFYSLNPTVEDLVKFSRQRPKAPVNLHKIRWDADKELIVIVPTIEVNSKLAENISSLLAPLPLIFVQSRGQYFNYAYSVNCGIKEALKFNPDWIVISNDDMYHIDTSSKLLAELRKIRDDECPFAIPGGTGQSLFHSIPSVVSPTIIDIPFNLMFSAVHGTRKLRTYMFQLSQIVKYKISLFVFSYGTRLDHLAPLAKIRNYMRFCVGRDIGGGKVFYNPGDFTIIRASLLRTEQYDDVFINACEDMDLSLRLFPVSQCRIIDFRIGSIAGASLSKTESTSTLRSCQDVLSWAYFFYKWKDKFG